ncbi:hypothetical protein IGI04_025373 [Brassica rapa subsp. trilocularis]|uniref:Retrotransposon gag domain-containing protein n=1 Tax=Brassica rapa subsp. trilocularis TaxID=1813537 RepID=A0ABQ7MBX6_BRACM|nr:hypothetical protein IGI04_025373 [Brassica rapa subsp. trilocularis]
MHSWEMFLGALKNNSEWRKLLLDLLHDALLLLCFTLIYIIFLVVTTHCHDPNPGPSDIQRGLNLLQKAQVSGSPELVAGATVCRDHVQLVTPDQHPRPPSCSSRREEAVDTNHTAIGARTKPLEPPEVSPLRGRETHAPSPSAGATVHSGHSPPSPTAVRRSRRDRPPSVRRREAAAVAAADFSVSRRHPPPLPPGLVPVIRRRLANSAESTRFRVYLSSWNRRAGVIIGPVLLGFWASIAFFRFYLYRAFRPLDFYRYVISYFKLSMPPRRRTTRAQTARAVRDNVDEHEQPAVPPPAAPPVDQDALRQMVQDAARQAAQEALQQIAQETARQAAQEAARVAAQEVARQMAAVQQGPQVQVQQGPQIRVQQVPPVQVQQNQHDHQDPVQQVPLPQVPLQQGPAQQFAHGVQDLPPPPPRPHVYPVYDERFYRLTCQMRNMDMEHFSGTVDAVAAHDWKLALQRKLEIIECPPELSLRLTMQYLRGDALIWWEGIQLSHFGPERLTFADFIREFDRKYFPKEAMDRKKCEFEHVSQGEMSIREYEVVFNQLRRFAGVGISEEDMIRKFLSGMRVEIRNRCRVVTYHRLGDLMEKAAEQEAGLAEEQKLTKAVHVKSGKAPESHSRGGEQSGPPSCSSRREEAVDTNHTAIGARTKPLEPPEVSPLRGRETHAPSPSAGATVHSGHSPPSPTAVRRSRRDRPPSVHAEKSCRRVAASPPSPPLIFRAGDSPATRQLGRVDPVRGYSRTPLTRLRTSNKIVLPDTETDFCMPDCMRGYGQSVDRLDRSLVWSINRLRAVTPSTLSEVLFGLLVGGESAPR